MKRKRIQYNELNEEIYNPKYWTRTRLIVCGLFILLFGFLFNFSLEEKINKALQSTLSTNDACPVLFEKAELSYFLPKVNLRKPVVMGRCFGQPNNSLPLQSFTIALAGPSFAPPGLKLNVSLKQGKTNINLNPSLSPFSQYVDISDSVLDSQIFGAMTENNKSPVAGTLALSGFLKFSSGVIEDGDIAISSKNFILPAQNIKGFEMTQINLNKLKFAAHFTNKTVMKIDQLDIGQPNTPIELKLKGNLVVNANNFMGSQLQLSGTLHLTDFILTNFSFVKLFLPENNTSGTYQMTLTGPLGNLAPPQFK
jgi:hypothetical protein